MTNAESAKEVSRTPMTSNGTIHDGGPRAADALFSRVLPAH